ncbi:MAG: hypothetical protein WCZ86_00880 [Desulfurivibrionaceae bacterium]|jgi:hypothetical protein
MEQTRENYYKMMGFGIAAMAAGAVTAVYFPVFWKAILPAPPGRENLHAFMAMVFSLSALLGSMRAALTVQVHLLPKCEMDEEERQRMQTYGSQSRRMLDQILIGMAALCVVVLLCNLF